MRGRDSWRARQRLKKLRRAARVARARRKRRERSPLGSFYWLPPQHEFLTWEPGENKHGVVVRAVLLRAGNQVYGKTTAGLAEVIYRCLGRHPFKEVPEAPITAWVICSSAKQSKAVQKKCWNLLPKDEIVPSCQFKEGTGFNANDPMVIFRNGSVIKFRTTKQDTLDLASDTIDVALFDEPPKTQRVFAEVRKRLLERNGVLLMTLTPINAPCGWLREECEKGAIHDIHYPLHLDYLVPVGRRRLHRTSAGILCNQAWIDQVIRESLGPEVPIVVHGEWEERQGERQFTAFIGVHGVPGAHVTQEARHTSRALRWVLGIDHGETGENQAFALLGVDEERALGSYHPVHLVDEHVAAGATSVEQDARDVLDLLERNGLQWSDLAYVGGDNPTSRSNRGKDNLRLMQAIRAELVSRAAPAARKALARQLRGVRNLRPQIKRVKAGRGSGSGSKRDGERWLQKLMCVDGAFGVYHHRWGTNPGDYVGCERFIECMHEYDGRPSSPYKHLPDAVRYGLNEYIKGIRGPVREPARQLAVA